MLKQFTSTRNAILSVLTLLGLIATLSSVSINTALAASTDKEKVVIQVSDNDPKKWNLAINNANNVLNALGGADKAEVEIVVYGPGIGMLKMDSEVGNRVDDALGKNIKVVACQNTMKAMKLTQADMLTSIGYVPAGVIEIMRKQQAGYAYIRP
ncbi:MAG: hypothetical protein GC149_19630 [Gammaproteobacteria bacterium]|nr:hypothetical protein [Gammaproteobacteria bacterium]